MSDLRRRVRCASVAIGLALAAALLAALVSARAADREPSKPATQKADSSLCYVCHLTMQTDEITVKHLAEGIGCEKCHGSSHEHMHDEMLMTKPDRLFGRQQVDAVCVNCHDKPHEEKRPELKSPPLTGSVHVPGKGLALVNVRDELLDDEGWNTLTIGVCGGRTTVRLNGEEIGAVVHDGPREGRIGLHAEGQGDFVVREILVQRL